MTCWLLSDILSRQVTSYNPIGGDWILECRDICTFLDSEGSSVHSHMTNFTWYRHWEQQKETHNLFFFSTPVLDSHHMFRYTVTTICISQQNSLYQFHCISFCCITVFVPPTASSVLNLFIDHILWTVNLHPTQSLADLVTELCHRRDQWQCTDILAAQMSALQLPGPAGRTSLNR